MRFIKKLILRLVYPRAYSNEVYIKTLREKHHITIGEHCKFWVPHQTHIDTQRPHMLHIGDYVKITRNVTILCHDYSRSVSCNMPGASNCGEARFTYIGNNVFIGMNATILMGTHIGDNSIVGAGAVVSGIFPDDVVIAGNPAHVICTIGEFYEKRKSEEMDAAKLYVKSWREKFSKDPSIYDMTNAFSWLYLPHTIDSVNRYPKLFELSSINKDIFFNNFLHTEPLYKNFDEFLKDCI